MENKKHSFDSFEVTGLTESRYLSPYRLKFKQNNVSRVWDGLLAHPSVSCLIYNKERDVIVLVRQFRPVVYVNQLLETQGDNQEPNKSMLQKLDWSKLDANNAFTFEMCAGICDKNKPLEETIKEEILEECGYAVDLKDIYRLRSYRMGVGMMGALHTIFYTEVDNKMKVSEGGGNEHEGEFIDVFELNAKEIKNFIDDEKHKDVLPPGLLYALTWFIYEREGFMKSKQN